MAEKVRDELEKKGYEVAFHRLKIEGGWHQGIKEIRFEEPPDAAAYDALVFGSPVEAFSLSPVMKTYLKDVGMLEGKKIALLVTQHFPSPSLGGNRAVRYMEKACAGRGRRRLRFGCRELDQTNEKSSRSLKASPACPALSTNDRDGAEG